MLGTILIIVLVSFLIGALPTWNHSRSWAYFPSGGLGLLLAIVVILLLLGRIEKPTFDISTQPCCRCQAVAHPELRLEYNTFGLTTNRTL